MAAGVTYTPIATYTIPSASNSYTFSSIPSTYTDLLIVGSAAGVTTDDIKIRYNGDSATNYSSTYVYGNQSAVSTNRRTNETAGTVAFYSNGMGSIHSPFTVNIMNYANSTTQKVSIGRSGRSGNDTHTTVTLWRGSATISSLTLIVNNSNNFAVGTVLTLYGITAA